MFNFQHSQTTQKEFEQLADLLLKYPKSYATSKFDVGKVISPFNVPLKPDNFFRKQRTYYRKKHYNSLKISHRGNPKTPTTFE